MLLIKINKMLNYITLSTSPYKFNDLHQHRDTSTPTNIENVQCNNLYRIYTRKILIISH